MPNAVTAFSGLPVIAAFNGISNLKFRRVPESMQPPCAAYSCHQLDRYLATGRPTVINCSVWKRGR